MWHTSYGNPSKKQILLRTFGTHRSTSSPINARRSNIWAEGRPTRPGEGVPGRTPKSKKNQNRRKSCSTVFKKSKISWFFQFFAPGRQPPSANRHPPTSQDSSQESSQESLLGAEMPSKALANCCSHSGLRREFPQHTFREWHRAGTQEIKSDFLARSQAQISGS